MNDELTGAIRNALERGFSLEQAIQSLINAGYNTAEVKEAAKFFNQSASSISSSFTVVGPPEEKPKVKSILSFSKPQPIQTQQVQPAAVQQPVQQPKSILSFSKPQPQQPVQQPISQSQSRPPTVEKQIQQSYPQITSQSIQAPQRNPIDVERERKQTIAMLLAILILLLGMVILILMFKTEILNLVS